MLFRSRDFQKINVLIEQGEKEKNTLPIYLDISNYKGEILENITIKSGSNLFIKQGDTRWIWKFPLKEAGKWQNVDLEIFQNDKLVSKQKFAFSKNYEKEFESLILSSKPIELLSQKSIEKLPEKDISYPFFEKKQKIGNIFILIAFLFGTIWYALCILRI